MKGAYLGLYLKTEAKYDSASKGLLNVPTHHNWNINKHGQTCHGQKWIFFFRIKHIGKYFERCIFNKLNFTPQFIFLFGNSQLRRESVSSKQANYWFVRCFFYSRIPVWNRKDYLNKLNSLLLKKILILKL